MLYPARREVMEGTTPGRKRENSLWKQDFGEPGVQDHAVGSLKSDAPGCLHETNSDRSGKNSVQFHQVSP